LASKLAACRKLFQQATGQLIEFRDAALNGVIAFKDGRDERVAVERSVWLGFKRDLHDEVIASGCDTWPDRLPCGLPWCARPGGGPTAFCLAPGQFRTSRCHRGSKFLWG